MIDPPSTEVECPQCGAGVGESCDQPVPHLARQDAAGDPGPFAAADLDDDGIRAWRDLDDPGTGSEAENME